MDGYEDPYAGLKFDPTNFDKALNKTKESFDNTIQEAGMQAGMASGQSGMNVSRVTADTYAKSMGSRDATMGQLEGQKAQAQAEFSQQKQILSAQSKAEYEKNKPGFMDWLSAGVGVASSIVTMNPAGIFGGAAKLGSNVAKLNYSPNKGAIPSKSPTPDISTNITAPTITDNSGMSTFNSGSSYSPFGQKKKSAFWSGAPFQLKPF